MHRKMRRNKIQRGRSAWPWEGQSGSLNFILLRPLGGYTWEGKADVSLGAVGTPEIHKAVLGGR